MSKNLNLVSKISDELGELEITTVAWFVCGWLAKGLMRAAPPLRTRRWSRCVREFEQWCPKIRTTCCRIAEQRATIFHKPKTLRCGLSAKRIGSQR